MPFFTTKARRHEENTRFTAETQRALRKSLSYAPGIFILTRSGDASRSGGEGIGAGKAQSAAFVEPPRCPEGDGDDDSAENARKRDAYGGSHDEIYE